MKKISETKILIVGDLMIDHYMIGTCDRISPEAPVPVVDIQSEHITLGGAGNVLQNILSFGGHAEILSVTGNDEAGKQIQSLLKKDHVHSEYILVDEKRKTSQKIRVLANRHQLLRIDKETKTDIQSDVEDKIIAILSEKIKLFDVILISDYLKGLLTNRVLSETIKMANKFNIPVVVDPKGDHFEKYRGADIIKPNRKEAGIAVGKTLKTIDDVYEAGKILREKIACKQVVITLSEEGMAIIGEDHVNIPTKANEVFDVTGAGDTVLASLGVCLACGLDLFDACKFANHAAAIVVSKIGSATATASEVLDHIANTSEDLGKFSRLIKGA